jgi:hypothetical protein
MNHRRARAVKARRFDGLWPTAPAADAQDFKTSTLRPTAPEISADEEPSAD